MTTFRIPHSCLLHGEKTDVLVQVDSSSIHWGNDGIGAYEYWGAKGFDHGTDYIEEFTVERVFELDTAKEFSERSREAIQYVLQDDHGFLDKLTGLFLAWSSDMQADALCQED